MRLQRVTASEASEASEGSEGSKASKSHGFLHPYQQIYLTHPPFTPAKVFDDMLFESAGIENSDEDSEGSEESSEASSF